MRGLDRPVYAFHRTGVVPLRESYRQIIASSGIDAIVLTDGGSDSLLRGIESDLGTPVEDVTSIAAVHGLERLPRFLAALAFGVDSHHGVAHAEVFEAIAEFTRKGGYLGTAALVPDMDETRAFVAAVDHARKDHDAKSIVSASVSSAIEGSFGDHHTVARTLGSELWINPLMAVYWAFDLDVVAKCNRYLTSIMASRTVTETVEHIRSFRQQIPKRPRRQIPI